MKRVDVLLFKLILLICTSHRTVSKYSITHRESSLVRTSRFTSAMHMSCVLNQPELNHLHTLLVVSSLAVHHSGPRWDNFSSEFSKPDGFAACAWNAKSTHSTNPQASATTNRIKALRLCKRCLSESAMSPLLNIEDRRRAHVERMLARAQKRSHQAQRIVEIWKAKLAELTGKALPQSRSGYMARRAFAGR